MSDVADAQAHEIAAAKLAVDRQVESIAGFWLRVAQLDIHQCRHCRTGRMIAIGPISPALARAPPGP
jgi:hypothetical protein